MIGKLYQPLAGPIQGKQIPIMMRRKTLFVAAVATTMALALGACSSDGGDAAPKGDKAVDDSSVADSPELDLVVAKEVTEHYAKGVYASYQVSIASAMELQTSLRAFTDNPSEQTLAAAKDRWLTARDDYLPTEAFRFYDGPIDDPESGPEGRINAWPMDEAYVDYVEGDPTAGIINDVAKYPEVTEAVLVETNEEGGETNISTGWHAIEFLLWGQDLSDTGPGERPFTDYTTAPNAQRRATYLNLLGDVLVSDLTSVAVQWDPSSSDNYRSKFLADPATAIGHMFRGIGALSVGELSGERIAVAIDTKDEEDEHSCFSDNTNADVVGDIIGINNVYFGTYPGMEKGPGLATLVEASDAQTATKLADQMRHTLELANNVPEAFDRMIVGDSAPLQEIIDSLSTQGKLIATSAKDLGISVDTGV